MTDTRNLVVCLDGTNNEPETGTTNVARIYDVAEKSDRQLVYYDPGVGTMGSRAAVTQAGLAFSRFAGLAAGHGIRDNIEEAYTWLSKNYQLGDEIYVFGFSRGAYTARALTGMLRTVGLLRRGTENLVPYAMKLYAQPGPRKAGSNSSDTATKDAERKFWKLRSEFKRQFGHPDFPDAFDEQRQPQKLVHFLGVWDTVKSVGWLNLKARIEMARWPFTSNVVNIGTARHAMAIDERRKPYGIYRFRQDLVDRTDDNYQEMWFAGVHSDVGGQFPDDHGLSDIAFAWMAEQAQLADMRFDEVRYRKLLGADIGQEMPSGHALGKIHTSPRVWWLAGFGWGGRKIRPTDPVHPSVLRRIDMTKDSDKPYRPKLNRS
jgi:uncharacterized protein (DUF2235 family)